MVKKQQKTKRPLSAVEWKQLFRISVVIVVLVLLWIVFAPGSGMFHLRQQKKHLADLKVQQEVLTQQNKEMKEDIERLRTDKVYLEKVAREDHGMLKDNEMVFDFAKEKKKK
ncbi:MAG TPA: septum formation initiator family protein [Desulfobacterales bacterium]|nr:septum formation initiator family protein [Desulfobacterales bacterium]